MELSTKLKAEEFPNTLITAVHPSLVSIFIYCT